MIVIFYCDDCDDYKGCDDYNDCDYGDCDFCNHYIDCDDYKGCDDYDD